ncbi:hypothetical protein ZEAMMB73_Zm00001d019821 [Zea mays]|uniref:Uncharacterized protein n=1 Tax=Zea mays TaxID=4577 RepID=A0A1D6I0F6_MAIZE|nr:hypothetical protein ZEAMMB73_Zm00001d019821 [Zea mays]
MKARTRDLAFSLLAARYSGSGNIRVPELNNLVPENQFSYFASDNLKEKSKFWTESTIQFDDLEGSALCDSSKNGLLNFIIAGAASPPSQLRRLPLFLLCTGGLLPGNIRVPELNNLVPENQFSYFASDNLKEKSKFWTESTIQFDDLEGSALCDSSKNGLLNFIIAGAASPPSQLRRLPLFLLCTGGLLPVAGVGAAACHWSLGPK